MKKAEKRQSEEAVMLLKDTHALIQAMLDSEHYHTAMELLEQCQSCAISLGERIEAIEGRGCPVIPFLENYCERIYEIYEKIGRSCPVHAASVYDALTAELSQIEDSIKKQISVKTEVVFLPYKASMWDSMESVWRAADAEPGCDAYVIPIPYYDKKPDGSFEAFHYEGGMYPDYVPITDYRDYQFAQRQPDIIFIHNPYDEYNYLTSVHPFFYARNLKPFTEKLVYIPYFIMGEPDPDNKEEVEYISHFCTTPGVIYGDKVIVQSEAMRQVYVNVMTKFMEGHGFVRQDWEEKILSLGSPKTDKVLTAGREDQKIPEEWMKVIKKKDGSLKKVVMYNTGLSTFLQNSRQYLDKMRDVFRIFREVNHNVALLWRPHPLLRDTIRTMRESLADDYERLLEEYCREGWGIYDDSGNLNRAIAVSDAYYGDGSSVVQLYEKVKKPVLIQNVSLQYKKRK